MDKCREEFESSLERTDGFHDGYVAWNEESGMYMANDDDYECMADWMNGAFAIYRKMQAKVEEMQKRVEALIQKYKDEDRELKLIDEWEQSQIYGLVAGELEQALKGGDQ